MPYRGKFWCGESWLIISYSAKFSSPIFTDTPKIHIASYLGYALTVIYLPNFSLPIAFTYMYSSPKFSLAKFSHVQYTCTLMHACIHTHSCMYTKTYMHTHLHTCVHTQTHMQHIRIHNTLYLPVRHSLKLEYIIICLGFQYNSHYFH